MIVVVWLTSNTWFFADGVRSTSLIPRSMNFWIPSSGSHSAAYDYCLSLSLAIRAWIMRKSEGDRGAGFTHKHGFTMSEGTKRPLEYGFYCLKKQEDCSRA